MIDFIIYGIVLFQRKIGRKEICKNKNNKTDKIYNNSEMPTVIVVISDCIPIPLQMV